MNIGARFARFATHSLSEDVKRPFEPQNSDRRFNDDLWKLLPYALWVQAFLAQETWWRSATSEVRGMTPNNAARVSFIIRQLLDMWSPSNAPWLNPVVTKRTLEESGANLTRGAHNFQEDFWRTLATRHVRYSPQSGHSSARFARPLSARSRHHLHLRAPASFARCDLSGSGLK